MLKLHTIKKHPKSVRRKKVVGRGLGSGHGTYSTRGGKGQTARTGHSKMPARFEGGRQPLIRQVPKARGFNSPVQKAFGFAASKLNAFSDGETVTVQALKDRGLVPVGTARVKVLAGEVKRKLTVKVPVSAAAKAAIEQVGGTVA